VATGYTGTVHFTSSDSQAVLPAEYTFTAANNGTRGFLVRLKTAGVQSITVTDTMTPSLTNTVSGITVTPAAAYSLKVTGFPSPVTSGTSQSFSVTAYDPYGNVATGYTGTIYFTSSDPQALLPLNFTFIAVDAGTYSFTATLNTIGTQSIRATDTVASAIKGIESGILVQAGGGPRPLIAAGAADGTPPGLILTLISPYANQALGGLGSFSFASNDGQAPLLPNDFFTTGESDRHHPRRAEFTLG
jgi:hypothetical protein